MISATVPATPEKFRKSFSVSLSGHIVHDSQHNHSSSAFSPGGRHPLKDRLAGVWLAMGCDSANLPPHVGFVFEWIQEIDPELVKIAHVAGHDRQPMHQGRRGDHGILQQGV